MYNIEINKNEKTLTVKGMGMYQQNELDTFMDDFKTKAKSVNSTDYTLILDTKSLITAQQEQVPTMEKIMNMYFETPFKERVYLKPDSKIAAMQMKRITENNAYNSLRILEGN